MKGIKENIIYIILVTSLFLSPLLMPNNGQQYTVVACCVFVALCFIFKVQSVIKTLIPVVCFSILMPMAVLIAIARPITTSWLGAASYFVKQSNGDIWLSFIIPVVLALILHLGLLRISVIRRRKTA